MNKHNKAVIVTGGTRGIGYDISLSLIASGYPVAVLYKRNEAAAENLKATAEKMGGSIELFKVSVDEYDEVAKCFKKVEETLGNIYGLINNAGITRDVFLMMMKKDDWDGVVSTNLLGTLNCSRAVIPYLLKNNEGRIINMSSIAGILGIASQTNYTATKAAIIGFTKALAAEYIAKGIYVYGLAPGYIETEMLNTIPDKILEQYRSAVPMKRFGNVSEISKVVLQLMGDDLSYATGQTYILDGGLCLA